MHSRVRIVPCFPRLMHDSMLRKNLTERFNKERGRLMNNPMRNRNWIFRTRWPAAGAGLALAIMLVLAVLATGSAQAQTFTTLHSFNGTDGSSPYAGLVQATDGNLYGTTGGGGANSYGTVFKITPSGTLTTLYSFCQQTGCADGTFPVAALVQATNGNFYGTADTYGVGDLGTVFEITPGGALTTLYSFNGPNGANPYMESLIQATDGNLYGTTRI